MELLLIRHALPKKIVNVDTPADPPLDDRGWRHAELLAEYLEPESIGAVWSSPMTRARQTAEPLAKLLGTEIVIDEHLSEWDRESNAYIPVEEMKATNHPMWQAMVAGEWAGAEDPATFQRNVVDAVERAISAHAGQRIAVVCHGGVINAYVSHILSVANSTGFFHPDYTSIHRVMASSSGVRSLRSLNEIAHLRGTGLLG